jgi:hypothetical protein
MEFLTGRHLWLPLGSLFAEIEKQWVHALLRLINGVLYWVYFKNHLAQWGGHPFPSPLQPPSPFPFLLLLLLLLLLKGIFVI